MLHSWETSFDIPRRTGRVKRTGKLKIFGFISKNSVPTIKIAKINICLDFGGEFVFILTIFLKIIEF